MGDRHVYDTVHPTSLINPNLPWFLVVRVPQAAQPVHEWLIFWLDLCLKNCFSTRESHLLFMKHQASACGQVTEDKQTPHLLCKVQGTIHCTDTTPHTRHTSACMASFFPPDFGQLIMDIQIFKCYHLYSTEQQVTCLANRRIDSCIDGRRKLVS